MKFVVAMETIQNIFLLNLLFSETFKCISDTLQNLMFVQLGVDEVVRGSRYPSLGIKPDPK